MFMNFLFMQRFCPVNHALSASYTRVKRQSKTRNDSWKIA
eukprot:UN24669